MQQTRRHGKFMSATVISVPFSPPMASFSFGSEAAHPVLAKIADPAGVKSSRAATSPHRHIRPGIAGHVFGNSCPVSFCQAFAVWECRRTGGAVQRYVPLWLCLARHERHHLAKCQSTCRVSASNCRVSSFHLTPKFMTCNF